MKGALTASLVYPARGSRPIGLVICIPSGRALNDQDENVVERFGVQLARQRESRAMEMGSMGRSSR